MAPEKWEVGSSEDVIGALMEKLVDPCLPLSASLNDPPPNQDDQKSVSRQMHAVVLLYNYYHRKQNPDLEFLDFVPFCKLTQKLRPSLIAYMKTVKESELTEWDGDEDQLSVTEKAIRDACSITKALDASKDVPTAEGCPISKVAVLLIDTKRENCLLQFGAVTEGVWSPIERELSQEILAEENESKKRKRNTWMASTDDGNMLLHLGFDAVKDVMTGVESSELGVLETHVAYSLSKVKSATQFYIILCPQSFSVNQSVPLEFLVESLQGALAEKCFDSWTATALVEYYQMLPYLGFISSWLPRKDSCVPTYHQSARNGSSKVSLENSENSSDKTDSRRVSQRKAKDDNTMESSKLRSEIAKFLGTPDTDANNNGKDLLPKGLSQDTAADKNVSEKPCKRFGNHDSLKGGSTSVASKELKRTDMNSTKTSRKSNNTGNKLNSNIKNRTRGKNVPEVGVDSEVEPNETLHRYENETANNGDINIPCNQIGDSATESPQVQPTPLKINIENAADSETLQNALALLYRKRQQLYSQMCTMGDLLAVYDDIIERIRDGADVGLARQCIEYIVSGTSDLLLKSKTRLSDAYFPGESSCQDLDYICLTNNWRPPRYFVEPSGDKFMSQVTVKSKDLKVSLEGDLECSPCEARESAAAKMIAKLRKGRMMEAD